MLDLHKGYCYLNLRLPFNNALEVGFQDVDRSSPPQARHFDMSLRLSFRGCDHAGLHFFLQFWRVFFEFKVYDVRHWDHEKDRWVRHVDPPDVKDASKSSPYRTACDVEPAQSAKRPPIAGPDPVKISE